MRPPERLNRTESNGEDWWPGQVVGIAGATKNLERITLEQLTQHEGNRIAQGILVGIVISCAHSASMGLRMAVQSAAKRSHRGVIHPGRLKKTYSRLRAHHITIDQKYRNRFDEFLATITRTIEQRYPEGTAREREKARVAGLLKQWSTASGVVEGTSKADWRFSTEEPAFALTSTYGLVGLHITEGKQMFPGLARQLSLVIARLYSAVGS